MKTKEETAADMREYRRRNREWLRTLYKRWYMQNGPERNRRRRKGASA